ELHGAGTVADDRHALARKVERRVPLRGVNERSGELAQAWYRRPARGGEATDGGDHDTGHKLLLGPVRQAQARVPGVGRLVVLREHALGAVPHLVGNAEVLCDALEVALYLLLGREVPRPVTTGEGVGVQVPRGVDAAAGVMV